MCGRYNLAEVDELSKRFGVYVDGLVPRYNIAPTQDVPVVVGGEVRSLSLMRWGLVPHWAKDLSMSSRMINARAETVDSKPTYKDSFCCRRCLVPADGFFEWLREDGRKIPYRFILTKGGLFAFAGLWSRWLSPQGKEIHSFTIITTEANCLVRTIHDRMPVILRPENEEYWLEGKDRAKLKELLVPYPAELMRSYRVADLCNSSRNDLPECVEPLKI